MYARTYVFMYSQLCRYVYIRFYVVSMSASLLIPVPITQCRFHNYISFRFKLHAVFWDYWNIFCVYSHPIRGSLALHGQIKVILNSTLGNEFYNSKVIFIQG
jgi:hypothetical protein